MAPRPTNTALARLLRRAEEEDPKTLAETFVDVNALFARLSSRDQQIVFGRRGTGKTHALSYLAEALRKSDQTAVYVDLRLLGSSGGIYSDAGISVAEAGTRLLIDVLQHVYDDLVDQALGGTASESSSGDTLLTKLDRLSEVIADVSVVGEAEQREMTGIDVNATVEAEVRAEVAGSGPRLSAFARHQDGRRLAAEREITMKGVARHRVHFGSVGNALRRLVPALAGQRLWLLLDEWSHVPMQLQPLLADLLRHSVLPIPGVTVKIAAIDQRPTFKLDRSDGSYVGMELGADVAADIDLDEFMVFTNDHDSAVDFFAQLFTRHIQAMGDAGVELPRFSDPVDFIDDAFASPNAFRELVRAAEGVPRDAMNIVSKAALHAGSERINLQHVREAARGWYMQDKQAGLKAKSDARDLLHWINDRVIGERRVRAFLIQQGTESHLIDWLYDARLLHLVKRGMAAKDRPGVRFDAYAVDYGCYVDLLATRGAAPRGLFRTDTDEVLDVPPDDPELIRGAILDLNTFTPPDVNERAAKKPEEFPRVEVSGHAKEGHAVLESVSELEALPGASGWYLLLEARQGIVAVPVRARPIRIGSSSNDHVRIRHASVAPRHAVAELNDDAVVLILDRGRNVFVNGRGIKVTRVAERDHVIIGSAEVLVAFVQQPAGQDALPAREAPASAR
ncbi:MAG TPA: FHA domain-containing protein [Thermoleophilaceae bacterium]|jgi:hypothetical protein